MQYMYSLFTICHCAIICIELSGIICYGVNYHWIYSNPIQRCTYLYLRRPLPRIEPNIVVWHSDAPTHNAHVQVFPDDRWQEHSSCILGSQWEHDTTGSQGTMMTSYCRAYWVPPLTSSVLDKEWITYSNILQPSPITTKMIPHPLH